ncbi:hypothetical protein FQN49_009009, partial [Arthroderma sp. PD_2]
LNPTPDQYVPGESCARPASTTWAMPKFPFYKVEPDESNVPSIPSSSEFFVGRKQTLGAHFERGNDDDRLDGAYASIICTLEPGLTGFCSPEAVHALSTFLEDIQPRHPIEILDSFQAKLTSDALR